ncbi:DUF2606 family protein [Alkalibaculum bacchi]|uniref:DUF2606 family protein n=1 Tax=Alkalibaculum bacchi TaxID=645887 RepID=UPI0026E922EB|nr:M23 family metallopeptidase [Alkalibaculum bacchi]
MKKKIFKDDHSNFKERALKLVNKEGFYVAIFLCITLVATMLVYFVNDNASNKDIANEDTAIVEQDTTEPIENTSTVVEEDTAVTEKPATETATQVEKTTKEEEPKTEQPKEQEPKPDTNLKEMVSPVGANEVVMAFSMGGEPVYSQTLQEFTSEHTGVDLKAEEGQEVKAALDGKVTKIYKDGKLGQTIIIQHSNGIETRYSNLEEKVAVTLNQSVSAGDAIGKIGKTAAFESEDPSHLHFEVWQNGKCINPSEYL